MLSASDGVNLAHNPKAGILGGTALSNCAKNYTPLWAETPTLGRDAQFG
jgi:hypothetical protein